MGGRIPATKMMNAAAQRNVQTMLDAAHNTQMLTIANTMALNSMQESIAMSNAFASQSKIEPLRRFPFAWISTY
jgi:hypothetical protein